MDIETLLSIPKSFYVSWRLVSFKSAFSLPILVRYNTLLKSVKGKLIHNNKKGKLIIGFGTVGIFDKTYERSILQIDGTIILEGYASFGHGARLSIFQGAQLVIGDNFDNPSSLTIVCKKNISIGENVIISWDTLIMDTDLHQIMDVKSRQPVGEDSKNVTIGDNVWIGARAMLLKGSNISNGSIIGAGTVVTNNIEEQASVAVGNPVRIVAKGYSLFR